MFVSEGDNAQDAINMTDELNKWLGFVKVTGVLFFSHLLILEFYSE